MRRFRRACSACPELRGTRAPRAGDRGRLRRVIARTERVGETAERDAMLARGARDRRPAEPDDLRQAARSPRWPRPPGAGRRSNTGSRRPTCSTSCDGYKLTRRLDEQARAPDARLRARASGRRGRAARPGGVDAYRADRPGQRPDAGAGETASSATWRAALGAAVAALLRADAESGAHQGLVFSSWSMVPDAIAALLSLRGRAPDGHRAKARHGYFDRPTHRAPIQFREVQGRLAGLRALRSSTPRRPSPRQPTRSTSLRTEGDGCPITQASGARRAASRAARSALHAAQEPGEREERWYWAGTGLARPETGAGDRWAGWTADCARWATRRPGRSTSANSLAVAGAGRLAGSAGRGRDPRRTSPTWRSAARPPGAARPDAGGRRACDADCARHADRPPPPDRAWASGALQPAREPRPAARDDDGALLAGGSATTAPRRPPGSARRIRPRARRGRGPAGPAARGQWRTVADDHVAALALRPPADRRSTTSTTGGPVGDRPFQMRGRFAMRFAPHGEDEERRRSARASSASRVQLAVLAVRPRHHLGRAGGPRLPPLLPRRRPLEPAVQPGRPRAARGPRAPLQGPRRPANLAAAHRARGARGWRIPIRGRRCSGPPALVARERTPISCPTGSATARRRSSVVSSSFPFSRESTRLGWLKRSLAIYRLAFGQPRQDDFLAWLAPSRRRALAGTNWRSCRIRLRP